MKHKKVIWISSYLPRSCGIAYYSENYIEALKKENPRIQIKIISHTDASLSDYPIIDLKDRKWINNVLKTIIREGPDIVHIQHEYGLYETYDDNNEHLLNLIKEIKKLGIAVVMTYHSVYKRLSPDFSSFVRRSLETIDAGIFHCEYQRKALKKNIGKIPKNVYVLPHGSEENLKFTRKSGNGNLIVGSAGLASERKGYLDLIRQWPNVVKKFPNATLSLELKPETAFETKEYIERILEEILKSPVSKKIEFIVKDYSKEEFYNRLASFDVLVLPYKSESQSGVLAHGFSVGTPAVVTDIEGLGAEIRNSKAGIPVKNRKHFYLAINKLLRSKRLREKYSKNALNYVRDVNGWSIISKKTLGIYEKI